MKYDGMTVNERLFSSGLINEFDEAVKVKDINKIIEILRTIKIDDYSIKDVLISFGLIDT